MLNLQKASFAIVVFFSGILSLAWINEDAYISFRFVENFVLGYGLVFNPGERVQGFTNPLLVLLLCPLRYLGFGLPTAALLLNFLCSALLAAVIYQLAKLKELSLSFIYVVLLAFFSSFSILTYQTSGLENSLSHLLIALVLFSFLTKQRTWLAFFLALAFLNRLDSLFLLWPFLVVVIIENYRSKTLLSMIFSFAPIIIWEVFAIIYYGAPLPNTYYAKVTSNSAESIIQGGIYFFELFSKEPLGSLVALSLFFTAACSFKSYNKEQKNFFLLSSLSIISFCFYMLHIGGDYMLGRFLTPLMVFGIIVSAYLLDSQLKQLKPSYICLACIPIAIASLMYTSRFEYTFNSSNVRSEWHSVEVGVKVSQVSRTGLKEGRAQIGRILKEKAEECGKITIFVRNIGMIPYYAGPNVEVIDVYGLTDYFVARSPALDIGMLSHQDREGFLAYSKYRNARYIDEYNIKRRGCSYYQKSTPVALPDDLRKRINEAELITQGSYFNPLRLNLIFRKMFFLD